MLIYIINNNIICCKNNKSILYFTYKCNINNKYVLYYAYLTCEFKETPFILIYIIRFKTHM